MPASTQKHIGSDTDEEKETRKQDEPHHKETLRHRLNSFRSLLNYFYEEQKQTPWQFLIGPAASQQNDFTLTHLWYMFILSFIPVCSLLTGLGFLQTYLASDSNLCDWKNRRNTCESVIVLFVTYRIGFAVSIFFLFTTILLLTTKSKEDIKTSYLHSGFWIEKIIIVLILSCVAFAFPPSSFDSVWVYVVLFGDFSVSCLQMFLLCDIVKTLHNIVRGYFKKTNKNILQRCVILFLEVLFPVSVLTVMISLSLYEGFTSIKKCPATISFAILNLVLVCFIVGFVLIAQRKFILVAFYVCSYSSFLTFKSIVFRRDLSSSTENITEDSINPPDVKTLITIIFLYATIIYGLVRRDNIQHYYFYYWVLCGENCVVARNKGNTQDKQSLKKNINLNETLLDLTLEEIDLCTKEHQNRERSDIKQNTGESKCVEVTYQEAFIHFILFLVSLKSTSTVTNYHLLKETFEDLEPVKPMMSSITTHVTSLVVLVLFSWILFTTHFNKHANHLSVRSLLETLLDFILQLFYKIFIKTPKYFENQSRSRYVYFIFFVCCFISACTVISPSYRQFLEKTSILCEHRATLGACVSQDPAYMGLFRVLVSTGSFFLVLSIVLYNVVTVSSNRNVIQHGCWILKAILITCIFITFINLPSKISRVWLYVSLTSTFLFTLLQLLCLLDAVGIVNTSWNHVKFAPSTMYYSSSSLTTFLYIASTAVFVCFYVYYAHNFNCKVTRLFISINLVLCISASLISVHPIVSSGGLLRSAVVTSFCMYLTWSALNYNPNEKCNPLARSLVMVAAKPSRDMVSLADFFFLITALLFFTIRIENIIPKLIKLKPIIKVRCCCKAHDNYTSPDDDVTTGLVNEDNDVKQIEKWLETCKYETSELPESPKLELPLRERILFGDNTCIYHGKLSQSSTMQHEEFLVPFSYSWFHFVYFLAASYIFILLTHWLEPIPGSGFKVSVHWAIMSVKMVASSTIVLLYIWTLIAPIIENSYKPI